MNDEFYKRLQILSKYCVIENIEVKQSFIPAMSYRNYYEVTGYNRISVDLDFIGIRPLEKLLDDLEKSSKYAYEEKLRENNPLLQKAWEEYQLLLKLST